MNKMKRGEEPTISAFLCALGKLGKEKVGVHLSPFRQENNPSFLICRSNKNWIDYSSDEKGNIYTLCWILNPSLKNNWKETFNYIDKTMGNPTQYVAPIVTTVSIDKPKNSQDFIVKTTPINMQRKYLTERGVIYTGLQDLGIEEVHLNSWNKRKGKTQTYNYIGMKNESGGYVLRNPLMKRQFGKSDISVMHMSKKAHTRHIKVFEGMFDYLSYRSRAKQDYTYVILNSTTNTQKAIDYIQAIVSFFNEEAIAIEISLYLDNGLGGDGATLKFKEAFSKAKDQRKFYAKFEDFNDYVLDKAPSKIPPYRFGRYGTNYCVKARKDGILFSFDTKKDMEVHIKEIKDVK